MPYPASALAFICICSPTQYLNGTLVQALELSSSNNTLLLGVLSISVSFIAIISAELQKTPELFTEITTAKVNSELSALIFPTCHVSILPTKFVVPVLGVILTNVAPIGNISFTTMPETFVCPSLVKVSVKVTLLPLKDVLVFTV